MRLPSRAATGNGDVGERRGDCDSRCVDSMTGCQAKKRLYKVLLKYRKTQYITVTPRGRPKTKTTTVTLRVTPELKAAAELAADRDHRSLTGLIEVLILNHCKNESIPVPASINKENSP